MLMNLHKHVWTEALQMDNFEEEGERNGERLKRLVGLAEGYEKRVKEETELTKEQLKTRYVGKLDPKKRKSTLPLASGELVQDANLEGLHRSGRRRTATHRRQHRFGVKKNDRQGSLRRSDERRRERTPREWWHGGR